MTAGNQNMIDREAFKRYVETMLQSNGVVTKHCRHCQEKILFLPVKQKRSGQVKYYLFDLYLESHFGNCKARQQQRQDQQKESHCTFEGKPLQYTDSK